MFTGVRKKTAGRQLFYRKIYGYFCSVYAFVILHLFSLNIFLWERFSRESPGDVHLVTDTLYISVGLLQKDGFEKMVILLKNIFKDLR